MSERVEFYDDDAKLDAARSLILAVRPEDRIRIINWLMDGFCMECGKVIPEGQSECYCMRED